MLVAFLSSQIVHYKGDVSSLRERKGLVELVSWIRRPAESKCDCIADSCQAISVFIVVTVNDSGERRIE